jgi:hypothetical protein
MVKLMPHVPRHSFYSRVALNNSNGTYLCASHMAGLCILNYSVSVFDPFLFIQSCHSHNASQAWMKSAHVRIVRSFKIIDAREHIGRVSVAFNSL